MLISLLAMSKFVGETKTTTKCSKCSKEFDPYDNLLSRGSVTLGGALIGARVGGHFGIVGGIPGVIAGATAGAIPGAAAGLIGGGVLDSMFVQCPHCNKKQRS